jgi:ribosomal protein S15P/S13E
MMRNNLLLVLTMFSPLVVLSLSAADKQDVTDPVLQEIIAAFNSRMPRFINKHGADLFVTDEPVTRASLMMALYEYDKSVKAIPTKDYASKLELAEIKNKVAILEKSMSPNTGGGSGDRDIAQIINDLGPNMPILLDNSLNDSQVFTKLKNEVLANRAAPGSSTGKSEKDDAELVALTKRIDHLERAITSTSSSPSSDEKEKAAKIADLSRRLAIVEQARANPSSVPVKNVSQEVDITELTRRVDRLEKKPVAVTASAPSPEENDNSAKIAELTHRLTLLEQRPVKMASPAIKNVATSGDVAELNRRIERLEQMNNSGTVVSAKTTNDDESMTDEIEKTRLQSKRDIAKLEKRLSQVEKGNSPDDETKRNTSTLTKMSLGISMIAALFIAR